MLAFIFFLLTSLSMADENFVAVGVSPASPLFEPKIAARDVDMDCVASVFSSIILPAPTNTEFGNWMGNASIAIPGCTATVPANMSSDYMSYATVWSSFASTAQSAVRNANYTCGDPYSLSVVAEGGYCNTSRTVFFTTANQTETVVLPKITDPGTLVAGLAGHSINAPPMLPFMAAGALLLALVL